MLSCQLLRAIGEIVLKVAPDGSAIEYVGARELLSVSPDVFEGRNLFELLPGDTVPSARQCFDAVVGDGKVRTFQYSLSDTDGQLRHFEAMVAQAEPGRLLVILRDVHVREVAKINAQESESRFRSMADHAPVLLWMAGIDGECDFFNTRWLEFTGRKMEQEIGVGWAEGVYFEDLQNCMSIYLDSFVKRSSFRMEYRLRNAQGEYRWLLDHGVPRYTPDGAFAGFIGSCIDITDAKVAQAQAREHAARLAVSLAEREALLTDLGNRSRELARSNAELEQFVYAASHDLRAPLRAIHMLSEWIGNDLQDSEHPEVRSQLALLQKRVSRMTVLLDDLLEYSRIGRDQHPTSVVDTGQLLSEVVEMLALPPGFVIDISDDLPTLETPTAPLKQIFANLLSNAVTHHDRKTGRIQIAAHENGQHVEFSIADDGPGIPAKFQQRVFQMFQTLQPRDRVEGSGIGLALVKKSVEAVGGDINLESDGRGCTFRFTWPKRWHQAAQ
jgi:PAS domain S-box-containing protein